MLIQAISLLQKQVKAEHGVDIGRIIDIIIDPACGKLLGFKIKTAFGQKILCSIDVTAYAPQFLLVKDEDALCERDEVLRIDEVLKQNIKIIGNKVVTKSGAKLGLCEDTVIDTETSSIVKIYVKARTMFGPLMPDRIIGADKIISIDEKAIIVKDDGFAPVKKLAKKLVRERELVGTPE